MRGVGNEGEMDSLARLLADVVVRRAEMVLDVAGSNKVGVDRRRKLGEHSLEGLAHDIAHDVEAATVGHAHHNRLNADFARAINDRLHAGNQRLAALKTKALLTAPLLRQKILKAFSADEAGEDKSTLLDVRLDLAASLNALADPVALLARGNVHVLDANRLAVCLLQPVDDLPQRHRGTISTHKARGERRSNRKLAVKILLRKAVILGLQLGRNLRVEVNLVDAQRIQIRNVVPAHLIRTDQRLHLEMISNDVCTDRRASRTSWRAAEAWGSNECFARGSTGGEILKIDIPRLVHGRRVLFPGTVHFVKVVAACTAEKSLAGMWLL
eukprot:Opistho-2@80271